MRRAALAVGALGLWGALAARMDLVERFLYFPTREFAFDAAAAPGLGVSDAWFAAEDGVRLHAWLVTPLGGFRHTVLHLHGNGGNLSDRWDLLRRLQARGVRTLILDYRGYGKSGGEPSEEGLYRDARAAYDHAVRALRTPPERVFVFGSSLGGAAAVELALRAPVGGLILESTFASVQAMARDLYPAIPVHLLARGKYDSVSKAPFLSVPALFLHGDRDEIVPFAQGRALYEAYGGKDKKFVPLRGAMHNDAYLVGGDAYFDEIAAFLARWDAS